MLPAARLPRYHRADTYPPILIGRPKLRILHALATFHYLSAPQLRRLLGYAPTSLREVQRHLTALYHAGYLERRPLPPPASYGSGPAVYCLGPKGIAHLRRAGLPPAGRFRASEELERSAPYLRHILSANDLLIAATLLARTRPDVQLLELRAERELRRTPGYASVSGRRVGVVPDGWARLTFAGRSWPIAFELDRGTEHTADARHKIRSLVRYLRGGYQRVFGEGYPTVAFVATTSEDRAAALRGWAEQVLDEEHQRPLAHLFAFACFDPAAATPADVFLSPRWHRPFERAPIPLLEGTPTAHPP